MVNGFWEQLHRPFYVLAPLANVTDAAFRRLIAKYGKPSAIWTEFVSADGLILGGEKARDALLKDLSYTEDERPIVAQLFSARPEVMEQAAALVAELGFDGLDINMGCPDRSIESQGAGAALMKDLGNAVAVINAAKRGAPKLPVSVKTRIGYNKNELEEWLPALLSTNLAAITIHARTRKEMSKVPAHWEEVERAVEIRNKVEPNTLIVGNGDIITIREAEQRIRETGADGIMLGKAIFGNPWLFAKQSSFQHSVECWNDEMEYVPTLKEKLNVMIEHTKLFEELLPHKNFSIMKKHYKAYVSGWDGAKELRSRLMEARNAQDVEQLTKGYIEHIHIGDTK